MMPVVYFDQLLGTAYTQKLAQHPKAGGNIFFSRFSTFFDHFTPFFSVPPQGVDQLLHVDQL